MSIGTIWNHRDFIQREYGKEDALEFEQIVKKYQAEQIGFERERIIKLLMNESRRCKQIAESIAMDEYMSEWDSEVFDTQSKFAIELIALIKGENK